MRTLRGVAAVLAALIAQTTSAQAPPGAGVNAVELGHVHVVVRDLDGALSWTKKVLDIEPSFRTEQNAGLPFGAFGIVLDKGDADSVATIGLRSRDCDADFKRLVSRGAEVIEPPTNRDYAPVRSAYLRGPGKLVVEVEQFTGPPPKPRN